MRPWIRRTVNAVSLVILIGVFAVAGLFAAAELGVIDTTSDPVVSGPENTSQIPSVSASEHPEIDGEALEIAVFERVNEKRTATGVHTFSHSEQVRLISRLHSKDMAERDYIDHVDPDGDGPEDRHAQYDGCDRPNENVVVTNVDSEDDINALADRAVKLWSESEGHNTTQLSDYYYVSGVGVHVTAEGRAYITQNFCREHPSA